MIVRLHDIARATGDTSLRTIADRLSDLVKKEQQNG